MEWWERASRQLWFLMSTSHSGSLFSTHWHRVNLAVNMAIVFGHSIWESGLHLQAGCVSVHTFEANFNLATLQLNTWNGVTWYAVTVSPSKGPAMDCHLHFWLHPYYKRLHRKPDEGLRGAEVNSCMTWGNTLSIPLIRLKTSICIRGYTWDYPETLPQCIRN